MEKLKRFQDCNKKCGSIKSFDRRSHNSNTYQQNFENINTENFSNENVCTNTSYSSLPGKKRKVVKDLSINCEKSSAIDEKKRDVLKVYLIHQEHDCQYYCTTSGGGKRVEQSEIENYASIHKYKRIEINKGQQEIIDAQISYHKAINQCNNSAQNLPNLNLMDYNHVNIVPQTTQKFGSPDTILPKQIDTLDGTGRPDIEGKFISTGQSTMVNVDTTRESKESSPPYYNCLKYRNALAISTLAFSAIMIMTFSVLYWNYYEALHRRMTKHSKGPWPILDHWGKV